MSPAELIGFLVLAGAAAYAQTLTGFAFGLITMGGVGLTGLLSLAGCRDDRERADAGRMPRRCS